MLVYVSAGQPLIQAVRRPGHLLHDRSLRPNALYYIMKQILPPLDRIFSLIGVNVFDWYVFVPCFINARLFFPASNVDNFEAAS